MLTLGALPPPISQAYGREPQSSLIRLGADQWLYVGCMIGSPYRLCSWLASPLYVSYCQEASGLEAFVPCCLSYV
jgi:hypothetical protein